MDDEKFRIDSAITFFGGKIGDFLSDRKNIDYDNFSLYWKSVVKYHMNPFYEPTGTFLIEVDVNETDVIQDVKVILQYAKYVRLQNIHATFGIPNELQSSSYLYHKEGHFKVKIYANSETFDCPYLISKMNLGSAELKMSSSPPHENKVITPLTDIQRETVDFYNKGGCNIFSFYYKLPCGKYYTPYGNYVMSELTLTSFGVIGNSVGSGKTLAVLACIRPRSIVIVPKFLIHQWKSQVELHTSLDVTVIENAKALKEVKQMKDIVIIDSGSYRSILWQTKYDSDFEHMFVDEAHKINIKSKLGKTIRMSKMKSKWFISATFSVYQLYTFILDHMICLDKLPAKKVIISKKQAFPQTVIDMKVIECNMENVEFFDKLYHILSGVNISSPEWPKIRRILRRVHTGGKVDQEVIFALLESCSTVKRKRNIEEKQTNQKALALRGDECPICMDYFSSPVQLICRHVFCKDCISTCMGFRVNKCPLCRKDIVDLYKPSWGTVVKEQKEQRSSITYTDITGKFTAFEKELFENYDHKPLVIYCRYEHTALKYKELCEKYGFSTIVTGFKGGSDARNHIERFRRGESRILILHNKYCEGIDLQIASNLWIMCTDMNNTIDIQCVGRITRIGQKSKSLNVRYFVFKDSFDSWVRDYKQANLTTMANRINFLYHTCHKKPGTKWNNIYRYAVDHFRNRNTSNCNIHPSRTTSNQVSIGVMYIDITHSRFV